MGLVVVFLGTFSLPVHAWDAIGHRIVARVAWDQLDPAIQQQSIDLLLAAPENADLASLLPKDLRPRWERERELFGQAATWADRMRDGEFPERREAYHRSPWHYTNHFWKPEDRGRASDVCQPLTSPKPAAANVVERIEVLRNQLADQNRTASERAIDLAWLLHLVGDIHQPLHASARITELEAKGDRGGNLFLLAEDDNLHAWWDRIAALGLPKRWYEQEDGYVGRVARLLRQKHPPDWRMTSDIVRQNPMIWSLQSFRTACSSLYPADLLRGEEPSRAYRRKSWEAAQRSMALAGYRLARLLELALGPLEAEADEGRSRTDADTSPTVEGH